MESAANVSILADRRIADRKWVAGAAEGERKELEHVKERQRSEW